jgi:glyoxylase-like metal-dependent hydrolase (beta-lactamase superfamily II)
MKNKAVSKELLPGVYCITDRMNMNMTLLVGRKQALLVDTGYGFDDLQDAVRQITDLPLIVVNTHGHHDHASGNYLFERVYIAEADIPVCNHYVTISRKRIWQQAKSRNIPLDDWTHDEYLEKPCGVLHILSERQIDLGEMTACMIDAPGHTPGSLTIYVPERKLILSGDDWNPTTWLFFPEAESVSVLRSSIAKLLERDFEWILPSHDAKLWPRSALETFYQATTPEHLQKYAESVPNMYPGKQIMVIHPQPDCYLYFDAEKAFCSPCFEEPSQENASCH